VARRDQLAVNQKHDIAKANEITSMTASAAMRITSDMMPSVVVSRLAALDITRQAEAWVCYDEVGELHYLASTMSHRSAQANIFIGEVSPDPTEGQHPTVDEVTRKYIGFFRNIAGDLLYKGTLGLFVSGAFWLVGLPTNNSRRGPRGEWILATMEWVVLSNREVTTNGSTVTINDGVIIQNFSVDDVYLIRVANEHPMYRARVDSPVMGALSILREIIGLHNHVMAQIRSRLISGGLFLIPSEASAALKAGSDTPDDDSFDPLIEALAEAMGTAIGDPSDAKGAIPIMAAVPEDTIEKFKLIDFWTKLDAEARNMRNDALNRLAIALDLPPEVMTGTAGESHWAGWLSREEIVTTHLKPPIDMIMRGLTKTLLWPMLMQGGMSAIEAMGYELGCSVNDLIQRPNRAEDAKDLFNSGVLSDKALRDANGFDDGDAPEESVPEEIIRMLFSAGRSSTAMFQNPGNLLPLINAMAVLLGVQDQLPTDAQVEIPAELVQNQMAPVEDVEAGDTEPANVAKATAAGRADKPAVDGSGPGKSVPAPKSAKASGASPNTSRDAAGPIRQTKSQSNTKADAPK